MQDESYFYARVKLAQKCHDPIAERPRKEHLLFVHRCRCVPHEEHSCLRRQGGFAHQLVKAQIIRMKYGKWCNRLRSIGGFAGAQKLQCVRMYAARLLQCSEAHELVVPGLGLQRAQHMPKTAHAFFRCFSFVKEHEGTRPLCSADTEAQLNKNLADIFLFKTRQSDIIEHNLDKFVELHFSFDKVNAGLAARLPWFGAGCGALTNNIALRTFALSDAAFPTALARAVAEYRNLNFSNRHADYSSFGGSSDDGFLCDDFRQASADGILLFFRMPFSIRLASFCHSVRNDNRHGNLLLLFSMKRKTKNPA